MKLYSTLKKQTRIRAKDNCWLCQPRVDISLPTTRCGHKQKIKTLYLIGIQTSYDELIQFIIFTPGEQLPITHSEVVNIVEEAYSTINMDNNRNNPYIRDAFEMC